jgi:hypothetical protein
MDHIRYKDLLNEVSVYVVMLTTMDLLVPVQGVLKMLRQMEEEAVPLLEIVSVVLEHTSI